MSPRIGRRDAIKAGLGTFLLTPGMVRSASSQILERGEAEQVLFPARGLPGGGQLEVRMTISDEHPDPDVREVARRVKPYNLESWYAEWTRVAEKNRQLAAGF